MKAKPLFLSLLVIIISFSLEAQKRNALNGKTPGKNVVKFLNRTGSMINNTHAAVKENKVYTGCLHKAQEKEKEAIAHFSKQELKLAVEKSYAARRYTFMAYNANVGAVPSDWKLTEQEVRMVYRMLPDPPKDEELKKELTDSDKTREAEDVPVKDPEGTEELPEPETVNRKTNSK